MVVADIVETVVLPITQLQAEETRIATSVPEIAGQFGPTNVGIAFVAVVDVARNELQKLEAAVV